ncbi:extracellular solute-binding protein [Paenibacillus athensensis]|uniref:Sugar ABC transporter n=1 Tax=Paenibacillus athensensis TaxID=1967502 RepID=A0A4Y8PYD4_9BACL|nr:extracellular solute-binding protein [Paenibacillus athensensis]MCD1259678.1 extracellular solute-binding protein [Paenibacillus athensensis]
MKRIPFMLLAAGLLTLASGCGNAGPEGGSKTGSAPEDAVHFDTATGRYSPPVTLTTVGSINPDLQFKYGENLEHNVHIRWAEERLGIRIRYAWTAPKANGGYDNKLRLEAAKGNLPDIVTTRDRAVTQELIDSGQFREAGSLFEQYASQTWKQAMQEDPEAWDSYIRGGRKMAIPILDYQYITDPVLWVRQDWLDKLKLQIPRTMQELETVLAAFTRDDPDGNGLDDTFGLSIGLRNGTSTWMGDSSWIFGAFGTVPMQWNKEADGKLAYGSVQPGAGEALKLMRRWIDEGYISRASEWYDETKAAELFVAGKAGIVAGPVWMYGWPLGELTAANPGAVVRPIPLPAGPQGSVQRRGTIPVNGAILINKNMKRPDIFFTYQNYLFDYYATSQGEFANGLAKDYDWAETEMGPTTDPAQIPGGLVRVASYTLTYDGARIPSKMLATIPDAVARVLLSQQAASRPDEFRGPLGPTMKAQGELLRSLELESMRSQLFADNPARFDDFVSDWLRYGGVQITHEANEWYASRAAAENK